MTSTTTAAVLLPTTSTAGMVSARDTAVATSIITHHTQQAQDEQEMLPITCLPEPCLVTQTSTPTNRTPYPAYPQQQQQQQQLPPQKLVQLPPEMSTAVAILMGGIPPPPPPSTPPPPRRSSSTSRGRAQSAGRANSSSSRRAEQQQQQQQQQRIQQHGQHQNHHRNPNSSSPRGGKEEQEGGGGIGGGGSGHHHHHHDKHHPIMPQRLSVEEIVRTARAIYYDSNNSADPPTTGEYSTGRPSGLSTPKQQEQQQQQQPYYPPNNNNNSRKEVDEVDEMENRYPMSILRHHHHHQHGSSSLPPSPRLVPVTEAVVPSSMVRRASNSSLSGGGGGAGGGGGGGAAAAATGEVVVVPMTMSYMSPLALSPMSVATQPMGNHHQLMQTQQQQTTQQSPGHMPLSPKNDANNNSNRAGGSTQMPSSLSLGGDHHHHAHSQDSNHKSMSTSPSTKKATSSSSTSSTSALMAAAVSSKKTRRQGRATSANRPKTPERRLRRPFTPSRRRSKSREKAAKGMTATATTGGNPDSHQQQPTKVQQQRSKSQERARSRSAERTQRQTKQPSEIQHRRRRGGGATVAASGSSLSANGNVGISASGSSALNISATDSGAEDSTHTASMEKMGFFQKIFGKRKSKSLGSTDSYDSKTVTSSSMKSPGQHNNKEDHHHHNLKSIGIGGGSTIHTALVSAIQLDEASVRDGGDGGARSDLPLGVASSTMSASRPAVFFASDEISTLTAPTYEEHRQRRLDPLEEKEPTSEDPVGQHWTDVRAAAAAAAQAMHHHRQQQQQQLLSSPNSVDPFTEPFFQNQPNANMALSSTMPWMMMPLRVKTDLRVDVVDPVGDSPLDRREKQPDASKVRPSAMQDPSPRATNYTAQQSPTTPMVANHGHQHHKNKKNHHNHHTYRDPSPKGHQQVPTALAGYSYRDPTGDSPLHLNQRGPSALRDGSPYAPDPPLHLLPLDLVSEGSSSEEEKKDDEALLAKLSSTSSDIPPPPPPPPPPTTPSPLARSHEILRIPVTPRRPSPRSTPTSSNTNAGVPSFASSLVMMMPAKETIASAAVSPRTPKMVSLPSSPTSSAAPTADPSASRTAGTNTPILMAVTSGRMSPRQQQQQKQRQRRTQDVEPKMADSPRAIVVEEAQLGVRNVKSDSTIEYEKPNVEEALLTGQRQPASLHMDAIEALLASPVPEQPIGSLDGKIETAAPQLQLAEAAESLPRPDVPVSVQSTEAVGEAVSHLAEPPGGINNAPAGQPGTKGKKNLTVASAARMNARAVKFLHRLSGEPSPRKVWGQSAGTSDEDNSPAHNNRNATPSAEKDLTFSLAEISVPAGSQRKDPVPADDGEIMKLFTAYSRRFRRRKQKKQIAAEPSGMSFESLTQKSSLPIDKVEPISRDVNLKKPLGRDVRVTGRAFAVGIMILRQAREEAIASGFSQRVVPIKKDKVPVVESYFAPTEVAEPRDPIQRAGRRLLAKAAVPIQAVARRYLAQRAAVDRMWALIEIQSYFRRWRAEASLMAYVLSALLIQRVVRGHNARVARDRQLFAATQIQRIFRGYLASALVFHEVYAIILAQARARGNLTRKRLRIEKQEKEKRFATALQRWWRGCKARVKYQFLVVDIIIVQSAVRRWRARRESALRQSHRRSTAARKIQSIWRGFQCYSDYIFSLVDILVVQRTARRWLAQRRVDRIRRHQQGLIRGTAALKIQAAWRRHTAQLELLYGLVHIILIQSLARRYLTRSIVTQRQHDIQKQVEAAIKLQAAWRGFWSFSHYVITQYEVTRLQAAVRGRLVRRRTNVMLGCGIMLQSAARRFLARRVVTRLKISQVMVHAPVEAMRGILGL